jgi:hypothetical protein
MKLKFIKIVCITILLFNNCGYLAAQSIEVKWDEPKITYEYNAGAAETEEGNIILLKMISTSTIFNSKNKAKASIILKNPELKIINKREYEAQDNNTSIISLSKIGRNIFLIYQVYDEKAKFTSFYADKFDQNSLRIIEKIKLGSFQSYSETNQATIKFTESNDKTKFSAFVINSTGTKNEYKSSVFTYDTELNILWTKQVNSNNSKYFNPSNFLVSNNGIVYLSSVFKFEEVKDNNKDKSGSYEFEVITLSEKEDKRANVNVTGVYIDFHHLLLDKKEETLTLLGFYQKLEGKNRTGIWYKKIGLKNSKTYNLVLQEFEKKLLSLVKIDEFANDEKDAGLDPKYQIVYIGERPNGSIDITSEFRIGNSGKTIFSSDNSYSSTSFYYGTIINTNIGLDGKLINTRVPKAQSFETNNLGDGSFIGFYPLLIGNNLHFIYNDCKSNFEQDLSKKVASIGKYKDAILVDSKIDTNGILTRNIAREVDKESYTTSPLKFIKISEKTIFIEGKRTKRFDDRTRYGIININK